MIDCLKFYQLLIENKIDFFTGVPDSLLKEFNSCILESSPKDQHIISANEGNAVALAAGYHLATGKYGLVYLQNSGLGHVVNPLTSLVNREMYQIPLLLMIGQRGEKGMQDEPQHTKMGGVTTDMLNLLGVPYEILTGDLSNSDAEQVVKKAVDYMVNSSLPYAFVVKKGSFQSYQRSDAPVSDCDVSREDAVRLVLDALTEQDIVMATTGKLSRELYEVRQQRGEKPDQDFLCVGSMGHCSQIALSTALTKSSRAVYCFDGDGAVIMHMGSLAVIGTHGPSNFKHIVFNNGAHDSVGGQPTVGHSIDIPAVATACGYRDVFKAVTQEEIKVGIDQLVKAQGPAMLEIKIKKGARKSLGRPPHSLVDAKKMFMKAVN